MDYAREEVYFTMAYIMPMVNARNMSREYRWNDMDIGTPQHKETNLYQCHYVTNPIRNKHG
jgi:hypothetical protein